MGSVVTVLKAQSVPVHSRVKVASVGHMDGDRRVLWSDERWAGNRAVVSEHPNHRAAYLFRHGSNLKRDLVSMHELEPLRRLRFWQPLGGCGELAFDGLMWTHRTSHALP